MKRLPGFIEATAACSNSTNPATVQFDVKNLAGTTVDVVRTTFAAPPSVSPVATDGFMLAPSGIAGGSESEAAATILRIGAGTGTSAQVGVVDLWFTVTATSCTASIEAQFSG